MGRSKGKRGSITAGSAMTASTRSSMQGKAGGGGKRVALDANLNLQL